MIPLFILTFNGLGYFQQWFDWGQFKDEVKLFIVDNGNQTETPSQLLVDNSYTYFRTSENIGCAGGWNLCADIGMNLFGFDKIIIGQDDAKFNLEMLQNVYNSTNDRVLSGAYGRGFTFSLFGLTQGIRNTLGRFDENIIYVTYEDADYTQKAYRAGIEVKSLNYNADLNSSRVSSQTFVDGPRKRNKEYMDEKWGIEWKNELPKSLALNETAPMGKNFINIYGVRDEFPSVTNYKKFKELYESRTI